MPRGLLSALVLGTLAACANGGRMNEPQPVASRVAGYGTWASPLSAARATAGSLRLSAVAVDGEDVYWLEGRPEEGGRNVLVRQSPGQMPVDLTSGPFNVRTRVHEYGGAPFVAHRGTVYASNFSDHLLYAFEAARTQPRAITPPGFAYAQCAVDERRGARLICVREDHRAAEGDAGPGAQPVAAIVALTIGPPGAPISAGRPLVSGADFFSDPQVSPDGTQLAWLQWNHPNMPWDGTELYVAPLDAEGRIASKPRRVAGGVDESIFQPRWSPDGRLYFISDRSGWWNLYRETRDGEVEPLLPRSADFGKPQWTFGTSTYGFESEDRLVVSWAEDGRWRLGRLRVSSGRLETLTTSVEVVDSLAVTSKAAWFIGGSATDAPAIVKLSADSIGAFEVVKRSNDDALDPRFVSRPEALTFRSGGEPTHAFYYPPTNPDFEAPAGATPPLIVLSHGGPTSATDAIYRPSLQFWTTRGFAVVDVNYGGSTGYGRAYRRRLNGEWGIVDVRDAIAAARHLVETGKADPARLITRGGSAGGYTTLAALTFHDTFKAGASYYGISDLEALARDTHKFESRYLDSLVGPYPAARDVYRARSPIHFVDRLDCALILFQGLDDKVVPPSQSQAMADAVRRKGLPVAYVAFEGEQHGFRKAENLVRALESELYFYGKVFGFEPADALAPLPIDNLSR
jgi:dipeptidyl aminopeptidase/acylaminoacyl peptidase